MCGFALQTRSKILSRLPISHQRHYISLSSLLVPKMFKTEVFLHRCHRQTGTGCGTGCLCMSLGSNQITEAFGTFNSHKNASRGPFAKSPRPCNRQPVKGLEGRTVQILTVKRFGISGEKSNFEILVTQLQLAAYNNKIRERYTNCDISIQQCAGPCQLREKSQGLGY